MKDAIKAIRNVMAFILLVIITWIYFPFALALTLAAVILRILFILRYMISEGWEYILETKNRKNTPNARNIQKILLIILTIFCVLLWLPNYIMRFLILICVGVPIFMYGYGLNNKKAKYYQLLTVPVEIIYTLCQDYLRECYFKNPPGLIKESNYLWS